MGFAGIFMKLLGWIIATLIIWPIDYFHLKDELRLEGCKLLKMRWRPIDWNGNWSNESRTYSVTYIDEMGHERIRQCRVDFGRGNIQWVEQKNIW